MQEHRSMRHIRRLQNIMKALIKDDSEIFLLSGQNRIVVARFKCASFDEIVSTRGDISVGNLGESRRR